MEIVERPAADCHELAVFLFGPFFVSISRHFVISCIFSAKKPWRPPWILAGDNWRMGLLFLVAHFQGTTNAGAENDTS